MIYGNNAILESTPFSNMQSRVFTEDDFEDLLEMMIYGGTNSAEMSLTEGANIDITVKLKNFLKVYSADMKMAKKYRKAKDFKAAKQYIAKAKKEIESIKNEIKNMNSTKESVAYGILATYVIELAMQFLPIVIIGTGLTISELFFKSGKKLIDDSIKNGKAINLSCCFLIKDAEVAKEISFDTKMLKIGSAVVNFGMIFSIIITIVDFVKILKTSTKEYDKKANEYDKKNPYRFEIIRFINELEIQIGKFEKSLDELDAAQKEINKMSKAKK